MKRIANTWFIAIFALLLAMPAQAQLLKLGVKGGVNLSSLRHFESFDSFKKHTTGFFIGPMLNLQTAVGFGAETAVMFSQRGEDDYLQRGIQVPVNLKYSFGLTRVMAAYLATGPDFYFNFKDIDNINLKKVYDENKCQVGVNVGGGLTVGKHLQLGVICTIPIGSSFTVKKAIDKTAQAIRDKVYNNWQVSIAYLY